MHAEPPAGRGGAPRESLLFLGPAELGSGGQSTQIGDGHRGARREGEEVGAGAIRGPAGTGRGPVSGPVVSVVGQEKDGQGAESGPRVREDQAVVLGGLSGGALGAWAELPQPRLVLQTAPLAEVGRGGGGRSGRPAGREGAPGK